MDKSELPKERSEKEKNIMEAKESFKTDPMDIEAVLIHLRHEIQQQKTEEILARYKVLPSNIILNQEKDLLADLFKEVDELNQKWDTFVLTDQILGNGKKGKLKRLAIRLFGWPGRQYNKAQVQINSYLTRTINASYNVQFLLQQRIEAQNEKIISQDTQILEINQKIKLLKEEMAILLETKKESK